MPQHQHVVIAVARCRRDRRDAGKTLGTYLVRWASSRGRRQASAEAPMPDVTSRRR